MFRHRESEFYKVWFTPRYFYGHTGTITGASFVPWHSRLLWRNWPSFNLSHVIALFRGKRPLLGISVSAYATSRQNSIKILKETSFELFAFFLCFGLFVYETADAALDWLEEAAARWLPLQWLQKRRFQMFARAVGSHDVRRKHGTVGRSLGIKAAWSRKQTAGAL